MESFDLSVSALVVFVFSFILLFHSQAVTPYYTAEVVVDCGSKWNSTALDGREWTGEYVSVSISGHSTSSIVVARSFLGVDPVPYLTSRISASPFHFTFQVNPGQKFIRFHFYPASYHGFDKCLDLFTVKAGPFILLNHFSATLASARLGVKFIVKEFCLNVEERGELRITFSPSESWESDNHIAYAFVNGIEVISMPAGLYYPPDGHRGALLVGQSNRFYAIDNSTALEMVHRFNIGGNFISPVEDFGMFRRWNADAAYFLDSGTSQMNHLAPQLAYRNVPLLSAPPKVYQTFWKTTLGKQRLYNFTWKIPVNVGFGYLVRLHFGDLDGAMADDDQREFIILVNNQIADMHADVIEWSGGTGFPVYKDYLVMMKGDREGSECNIVINLQSLNAISLGLLKGLEIFKLSNLENCLATSDPASLKKASTTWDLKIRSHLSLFSRRNVFGTGLTILTLIVSTIVYCLRKIWEDNVQSMDEAESVSVVPHFSLADIKSATQNFSDQFEIGRGGFGNVYKGRVSGFPGIVAIKRLSLLSRQGAHEFWTEIATLSKLRHNNLVSLIGYCNENKEMILLYEYITGGTLAENLYKFARKGKDCAVLSWEQRLSICIGAARGLEYLHTGSKPGIIHRDVKDTNILLDDNFIAKISDFGLSKLEELTESKSYISTKIKGTKGYLDPHYCTTHRLTRKSDVYSLGVVMLVVLSGRPALDTRNRVEPRSILVDFQECLANGEYDGIVDPGIFKNISPGSLREFVRCVENCLHQQPKNRPTMAQLVGSLELVLQLQEKPIVSAPGDAAVEVPPVHHIELVTTLSSEMSLGPVATFEDSTVSAPMGEITIKKDLSRKEVPNHARKLFRIWPWNIGQNRGTIAELKPLKKEEPYERGLKMGSQIRYGRLIFVHGSNLNFGSADLLAAPAERLGNGSCGITYKAILGDGIVAVKLLKNVIVGKQEFELQMEEVGRIRHENVLPLRAYYYAREGMLLIYDYYSRGSVHTLLHGSRGPSLDWEGRVRVAIGAARGIAHLHEESPSAVHGNIKASNIFLNSQQYGCVSDLSLASPRASPVLKPSGYTAPEVIRTSKISQGSDVYSFGILLLELLTGKSPGEGIIDLASCVPSEIFDSKICWNSRVAKEMLKMFGIGVRCVALPSVKRPKMKEVAEMLGDVRTGEPLDLTESLSTWRVFD